MRKAMLAFVLLVLLVSLAAPALAQDRGSIMDVLANDPDARFTMFISALEGSGLADTLTNQGPFTVFAPTDEAFQAWLDAHGTTLELFMQHPQAATVLTYHIAIDQNRYVDLISTDTLPTLQGEDLTLALDAGILTVNGAVVDDVDNFADNGVMQVIEDVLVPPSIADQFPIAPTPEATADIAETEAAEPT